MKRASKAIWTIS